MGQTVVKELRKHGRRDAMFAQVEQEVELELERQKQHFRPDSINQLATKTHFTRTELQFLYRSFKENCPSGFVSLEKFKEIYSGFFYYGDASHYAELVFNTFDEDGNGQISFEEFVHGLSVLWKGEKQLKIEWIFDLYDCDHRGYITHDNLITVLNAIYKLVGRNSYPTITKTTIHDHAMEIFAKLDENKDGKITLEEFVEFCSKDETIGQSLELFNTFVGPIGSATRTHIVTDLRNIT